MLFSLLKTIPLWLSLTSSILANGYNIEDVSSTGVGCTGNVAATSAGFDVYIYEYLNLDVTKYDNDWFINSFTKGAPYNSGGGVFQASESFTKRLTGTVSYNGRVWNNTNSVLQFKGYFIGMYLSSGADIKNFQDFGSVYFTSNIIKY